MSERVAAADFGSNSVRLLLAQRTGQGLEKLLSMRFVTRLGETPGTLSPASIERTLQAAREFLAALAPYGDVPLHAFATSAVRDANNRHALLEPLAELGVRVDVLSGEREAALACAVLPETGSCIDIGGGSTELLIKRGGASECKSYAAGAVRAKALFGERDALPPAFFEWLASVFATGADQDPRAPQALQGLPQLPEPVYGAGGTITLPRLPEPVYGAGGTITTLAALISGADHERLEGVAFSRDQLSGAMRAIAAMPRSERLRHPLLSDRADIILYGAGILDHIMELYDIQSVCATLVDNLYAYLYCFCMF